MSLTGRIVHRLPVWVRTSPLDVMFVLMGIPSALASLVGLARSGALAEILPDWGTKVWGAMILIGCIAWLAGLTSIRENNGHLVLTRLPALLFGLHLVSLAALVYGLAVILFAGWSGLFPSVAFFVVAGGTWLRRVDISERLRGNP